MTLEGTIRPRLTCRFCKNVFRLIIEMTLTEKTKLPEDVISAIQDEQDSLGWLAGACPECAVKHRKTLLEEHRADDDKPEWEGGEYV